MTSDSDSFVGALELVEGPKKSGVHYIAGGHKLGDPEREQVAQRLAAESMRIRVGNSPLFDQWCAQRDGRKSAVQSKRDALRIYASLGFGSPEKPANNDHLQGLVAELFWNQLVKERARLSDGRELVRVHQVKPDPLEPGGDGLAVYRVDDVLVFRLWEIKKHDSKSASVASTIRRAANQLSTRGSEYLAKLAGPETLDEVGPLGDFYADIVELWIGRDERAGVGVSVGTSSQFMPSGPRTFGSIKRRFPDLSNPGQMEAIVIAVPDFPEFALRVREIVWSGL